MSDIGLFNGFWSQAAIILILASPGIAAGAIAGAFGWRGHRIWGALLGAITGGALWFCGWAWLNDVI